MARRVALILGGVGLYALTVVYPPLRIVEWLLPQMFMSSLPWVLFLQLALLPPYMSRRIRNHLARPLTLFLNTVYGLMYLLFLTLVIVELLRFAIPMSNPISGVVVVSSWAVFAGFCVSRALTLPIKNVRLMGNELCRGKKLVQISDVHIGTRKPAYLQRVVKKIKSINPDAVLITGDLVDAKKVSTDDLACLSKLSAPTLFCTGNHERYEHCEQIVQWLRDHDVQVLRNESYVSNPFQFIGIEDSESPHTVQEELGKMHQEAELFKILLHHKPMGVDAAASWGIDLMVSGHTHHGQIFPFGWIVKTEFDPYRGTHKIGSMTLHISAGTGTTGPLLRLGSRNEITEFVFT